METSFNKTAQLDGSVKVAVGDLFADEQKDFLLELELPSLRAVADIVQPVMLVQARYLDVSNASMQSASFEVTVTRSVDTAGLQPSNPIVLVRMALRLVLQMASVCCGVTHVTQVACCYLFSTFRFLVGGCKPD